MAPDLRKASIYRLPMIFCLYLRGGMYIEVGQRWPVLALPPGSGGTPAKLTHKVTSIYEMEPDDLWEPESHEPPEEPDEDETPRMRFRGKLTDAPLPPKGHGLRADGSIYRLERGQLWHPIYGPYQDADHKPSEPETRYMVHGLDDDAIKAWHDMNADALKNGRSVKAETEFLKLVERVGLTTTILGRDVVRPDRLVEPNEVIETLATLYEGTQNTDAASNGVHEDVQNAGPN